MKLFFLLNPRDPSRMWDLRELSARVARRFGHQARFGEVQRTRENATEQLLRQVEEEDCERLAILGGDGTFNRVINLLHRSGRLARTELALLPGGTCNDFARQWGLSPRKLEAALELACRGQAQPVDLGVMRRDDGARALFLNNAGFGRRPAQTRAATAKRRRVSPWGTLRRFVPTPMRLAWDGGSLEGSFFMGMVCNGPYFSGGLHFSRAPHPRDGLLDAYWVPPISRWRLAGTLLRSRLRGHLVSAGIIALRTTHVEITASGDLWPQADGEPPDPRPCRGVSFSLADQKVMIVTP